LAAETEKERKKRSITPRAVRGGTKVAAHWRTGVFEENLISAVFFKNG